MALHVTIRGEGETVLLLHSGGMSSRQWRRLSDRLSSSFRVVAPDFPGSGSNPLWPDDRPFDLSLDLRPSTPWWRAPFTSWDTPTADCSH